MITCAAPDCDSRYTHAIWVTIDVKVNSQTLLFDTHVYVCKDHDPTGVE